MFVPSSHLSAPREPPFGPFIAGPGGIMNMKLVRSLFSLMFFSLLLPALASVADDGNVLRATLANGLRVVIVPNGLAPVVTTEVNYLAGSNEAPDGFPGMAHAQEHMMFRGNPGLSADQLANIIALMGGDFNADTQQTVTQYFLTVPKDDLGVALNLEAVRMQDVLDSDELWDRERGAIEQEVAQDLSNPEYVFSLRLLQHLFTGTPYAHDALGTRSSFDRTTGAMLKKFYRTWYAPNNAILVIAGDVAPARTLEMVKKLFEPIPRRPVPRRPEIRLGPLAPAAIELDTDLPYGLAVVTYRLPGYDSPDFAAGQVLADALDSQRGNLYALVPAGKALFTSFDGDSLPKASYGAASAAFPVGDDGATLITSIKAIIAGYAKNGVPPDIVEASKRHEIADAEFQTNSISGLAAAWSQALAVEGRSSPADDIAAIKQVTAEDVNRVLRKYLVNETAITAVLTPRSSGNPMSAKGFGGKESFAPEKAVLAELPGWAKRVVLPPDVPPSRVRPAVFTLSNGIRLIVQPETVSPTLTVAGHIKNRPGLQQPPGKEGVADVLENLFSYGTTTLDRLAFQQAQDDIGAEISAGTAFSLRVLADQADRGMALLADNLLRPALPDAAFMIERRKQASSLPGLLKSPSYISQRTLREGLYPKNDPSLRHALPETVGKLTPGDVRSYYETVFRPDLTTIVVIGKTTPEQAKALVEKYFGSWKASGPTPSTDLPPVPLNKPSAARVPDESRVQAEVTLAETIGITRSHPDYYALALGNHVLSGGFYASRLYHDLREQAGLVYTVESFLNAGKTRSVFGVYFACDPGNVANARSLVERDLRALQDVPVSETELRRAKILLVRQVPLSEESTDAIAGGLLSRSEEGLPLDEPVRAAANYLAMSAGEVRKAFGKWIRPDDLVQVTVEPAAKP
jgi:zinc protease